MSIACAITGMIAGGLAGGKIGYALGVLGGFSLAGHLFQPKEAPCDR